MDLLNLKIDENHSIEYSDIENVGIELERFEIVKNQINTNIEQLNTVSIEEFDYRFDTNFNLKKIEIPINTKIQESITFNFQNDQNMTMMTKIKINYDFDISSNQKVFIKIYHNFDLIKLQILVDNSIQYEIQNNENQDLHKFKQSLQDFSLEKKKQLLNQNIGYKKSIEIERIGELVKVNNNSLNFRDHYRTVLKQESENLVDELKLLQKVKNPDENNFNDDNLILCNDLFAKGQENRKSILKIWRSIILIFVIFLSTYIVTIDNFYGYNYIHNSVQDKIKNGDECDLELGKLVNPEDNKLKNIKNVFKYQCSNYDTDQIDESDKSLERQRITQNMFDQLKGNIKNNDDCGIANFFVDKQIVSILSVLILMLSLLINQIYRNIFQKYKTFKIILVRSQMVIMFLILSSITNSFGDQFMAKNVQFFVDEKYVLLNQFAQYNFNNNQIYFLKSHAENALYQFIVSLVLLVLMILDYFISNINKINSLNRRDILKIFVLMTIMQFYQNNLQNGKFIQFNFETKNNELNLQKVIDCPDTCKNELFQVTFQQNTYSNLLQDMKSIYCIIAFTIEIFLYQILEIILRLKKR